MTTESNQKEPLDLHALHTLYSGCTPAEKNELIERIWTAQRNLGRLLERNQMLRVEAKLDDAVIKELTAENAKLEEVVREQQESLTAIRDGDHECDCNHSDDNCCVKVGYSCAFCDASVALNKADEILKGRP